MLQHNVKHMGSQKKGGGDSSKTNCEILFPKKLVSVGPVTNYYNVS